MHKQIKTRITGEAVLREVATKKPHELKKEIYPATNLNKNDPNSSQEDYPGIFPKLPQLNKFNKIGK